MKITIESTDVFSRVGGDNVRVWRGVTENGVKCELFIALLRVERWQDLSKFDRELKELPAPSRVISPQEPL